MLSRRNGHISRSVLSALAALVTAAVPTFMSTSAMAETNKDKDDSAQSQTQEKSAASSTKTKHHKVSHAPKGQKRASKDDKKEHSRASSHDDKPVDAPLMKVDSDKSEKTDKKVASTKGNKKTSKKGPSKKSGAKKTAKKSDSDAPRRRGSNAHPARPCTAKPVAIDRGGIERESMPLVDCKGSMLESSREKLSVLARPWAAAKPAALPAEKEIQLDAKKGVEIAQGVKLLDRGLLTRLEAITTKFPGRSLSVVSGYRPQSNGSQHQAGKALDVRVNGVSNEELVAFCKTMQDTGCGYYPNSSFVHVDVRTPGTGSVTWIDASGPGETPRYVTQWPPLGTKNREVVARAAAIDDDDETDAPADIVEGSRALDRD